MMSLLEKTRMVNKILQGTEDNSLSFKSLSSVLSDVLVANVYIASRRGRVLGIGIVADYECDILTRELIGDNRFPENYNNKLLKIYETMANIPESSPLCVFDNKSDCPYPNKNVTIVPINGGGERLGTLVISRYGNSFSDEDLVLAEYGATVVGMEILRSKADEIEKDVRKKAVVQMAMGTLSYSEQRAITHIFAELNGLEGLLVASKIADKADITRSVIVNALRKLESAGVIESRSLGMKGTHIKIINDKLLEHEEIKKYLKR